jgi:antibiotic biosynthesis monooxygenase (ABM) superfamily enzyme
VIEGEPRYERLSTGLTWFLMPLLMRLFKFWLYPNTGDRLSRS